MTEPTAKINDNHSQESALQGLVDYCKEQSIFISPNIAAQSFPGRGLGVYTLNPIRKGEKLIHVPTQALLTTQSIPDTFLSKPVRKRFTVHCALAAFLAFGSDQDLAPYRRWMATWPKLDEFVATIPVFWTGDFRKAQDSNTVAESEGERRTKRRRTLNGDTNSVLHDSKAPSFSRSPAIDDDWLTVQRAQPTETTKITHVQTQAAKIRTCIHTIEKYIPNLKLRDHSSHASYLKFLHTWSCVNTRCFYYLRPGQAAPEDSNEAMALCPFQDLFNHSDAKGCTGIFDKRGFYVTADKDYKEGEELFLQYGKHTNDMLWMEYGFMMDKNKDDEVKLDRIVAETGGFSDEQKQMLEKAGYAGDYTLRTDGTCYRTTIASYLGIMNNAQWKRMVGGGLDPETSTVHATARLKAKKRVVDWIMQVRKEAEANLKVLSNTTDESELRRAFVGEASLTQAQRASTSTQVQLAQARRDMCVHRWKQVFDMCMSAARSIESDCAGAFVAEDTAGRSAADLHVNADQFLGDLTANDQGS